MSLVGSVDEIWPEVVFSDGKTVRKRVVMQVMFEILVEQSKS